MVSPTGEATPLGPWPIVEGNYSRTDAMQRNWERHPISAPDTAQRINVSQINVVPSSTNLGLTSDQEPNRSTTLVEHRRAMREQSLTHVPAIPHNRSNNADTSRNNNATSHTGRDPLNHGTVNSTNTIQQRNMTSRDHRTREQRRTARVRIAAQGAWKNPMSNTQFDGNGLVCAICLEEHEGSEQRSRLMYRHILNKLSH